MADPLSVTGSVVGIVSLGIQVTQSVHDYYVSFKSQQSDTRLLLQKLKDLQALFGQLLSHLLADRKSRPEDDCVIQSIRSTLQQCDAGIQKLKLEAEKFHLQTPAGGIQAAVKSTTRRLAYPFRQATLQGLEKDIEDLKSHVSLALSLLQQKTVDRLEDDVGKITEVLDSVRISQVSSEIRDWLDAPDASIGFQEACRKKHPGTGLWLINGPTFRGWLEQPSSFLWLKGFAGSGKSVLCSTSIQYTLRHHGGAYESGSRVGIAFFFFAFSDDSKQSASSMLRALVMQLADQLETTPLILKHLYEKHKRGSPPDLGLLDCLRQIVRMFGDVYIFLDALDESPQNIYRDSVLETIGDIRGWSEPGLHLLVTSRGAVDIRDGLQAAPSEIVNMSNSNVDKDIAVFVTQFLQSNPRLQKWKSCHSWIEETLINKADGVFRWVQCQLAEVARCPKSVDLLGRLLRSLPQTLDETYERMLRNVPLVSRDYAQQMLIVLCCARRPLTIRELIDAIAITMEPHPHFDPDRRLEDFDALEEVCPGFIEVDVIQRRKKSSAVVRIAHFSIQEYLESDRIYEQPETAVFGVKKEAGHATMASICLAWLLDTRLAKLEVRKLRSQYPLAKYAAREWPHHFRRGVSAEAAKAQAIDLFQNANDEMKTWIGIHEFDASVGERESDLSAPFYYASLLGILPALEHCCQSYAAAEPYTTISDLLNSRSGSFGTALQAASTRGHTEVVKLLLAHGADPNVHHELRTALMAAVEFVHTDVVELLLDNGADINLGVPRLYATALQTACGYGHVELVRLLLKRGANVNAPGDFCGHALMVASTEGASEEIVRILIDEGAEVDATSPDAMYGTALFGASSYGHEAIVELLVSKGADMDLHTTGLLASGTAVTAAFERGRHGVQRILTKGMTGRDERSATYLVGAAARGQVELVRFILDKIDEAEETHSETEPVSRPISAPLLRKAFRMDRPRGSEGQAINLAFCEALSNAHGEIVGMLTTYMFNEIRRRAESASIIRLTPETSSNDLLLEDVGCVGDYEVHPRFPNSAQTHLTPELTRTIDTSKDHNVTKNESDRGTKLEKSMAWYEGMQIATATLKSISSDHTTALDLRVAFLEHIYSLSQECLRSRDRGN